MLLKKFTLAPGYGQQWRAVRLPDLPVGGRAAAWPNTEDQAVKDELLSNTNASVERGTFGSPTFFVGDEIFFGKDRLVEIEEEIERQK